VPIFIDRGAPIKTLYYMGLFNWSYSLVREQTFLASYGQVFRALPYLPGSSEDNVREPKSEEPDTLALKRRLMMLEHRLPIVFE
jgi:hypothetical protein